MVTKLWNHTKREVFFYKKVCDTYFIVIYFVEIGLQWNNFYISGTGSDKDFTMLNVFILFIAQVISYMLFTYYVDSVNPGPYGIAKSMFFLLLTLKRYKTFLKMFKDDLANLHYFSLFVNYVEAMIVK